MCEGGHHWALSSAAGAVIRGQIRPLCSVSYDLPDCAIRRGFHRAMDGIFAPRSPAAIQHHCLHIHAAWLVGSALRGPCAKP